MVKGQTPEVMLIQSRGDTEVCPTLSQTFIEVSSKNMTIKMWCVKNKPKKKKKA